MSGLLNWTTIATSIPPQSLGWASAIEQHSQYRMINATINSEHPPMLDIFQLPRGGTKIRRKQKSHAQFAYAGHHSPVHAWQFSTFSLHQSPSSWQFEQSGPQQHFPGAGEGAGGGGAGAGPTFVVSLQFEMYAGFMLQCSGPVPQSSPSIQF